MAQQIYPMVGITHPRLPTPPQQAYRYTPHDGKFGHVMGNYRARANN